MHPLATALDTDWHDNRHETPVKRRTSLDNSCLSAHESIRLMLDDEEFEDTARRTPRRRSLDHSVRITATFLADGTSPHVKKGDDLDLDCHILDDSKRSKSGMSMTAALNFDSDNEDDSSLDDSDCDSFCDASFQDEANKDYIENNLGASCYWGDASLSEVQGDIEGIIEEQFADMDNSRPEMISEDGAMPDEPLHNHDFKPDEDGGGENHPAVRRQRRRSLTKKIPKIIFRSKSPKVLIRKKSGDVLASGSCRSLGDEEIGSRIPRVIIRKKSGDISSLSLGGFEDVSRSPASVAGTITSTGGNRRILVRKKSLNSQAPTVGLNRSGSSKSLGAAGAGAEEKEKKGPNIPRVLIRKKSAGSCSSTSLSLGD